MLKDFLNTCYKRYGDEYDYSKVEYIDNYTPITIICKKHGEFITTPFKHSHGGYCEKCFKEKNPYIVNNIVITRSELRKSMENR